MSGPNSPSSHDGGLGNAEYAAEMKRLQDDLKDWQMKLTKGEIDMKKFELVHAAIQKAIQDLRA